MKVRVAAILPEEDRILLAQHRRRGRSYWTFPGGHVKEGETLFHALVREMQEEAGLLIRPVRLLYAADVLTPDYDHHHIVNLFFLVENLGNIPSGTRPGLNEHLDRVAFVPVADIASLELYPPMAEVIAQDFPTGFQKQARYLGNLWINPESLLAERGTAFSNADLVAG